MTRQRIEFLLRLLKTQQLDESQWTELMQAFGDDAFRDLLTSDMLQALKEKNTHEAWTPTAQQETWNKIILATTPVRRIPIWRRTSVAAAAMLILSMSIYFYFSKKEKPALAQIPVHMDLKAPQANRAMITLAGGRKVFLDSVSKGNLANQGNVSLQKLSDGQIIYSGNTAEIIFNTLTNPRGSRPVTMTLTDGTKVWLNAGSSLVYPVSFSGHERNVEITGEAYFEVAHNPSMPFTVKKSNSDTKIQVLGTHFNINAYDDESSVKVTLLEGSVKVSSKNKNTIIKPNQQAIMNGSEIKVNSDVDTDEVMAWTTGFFQFNQLDLPSIMRQVARWYDLDITYETEVKSDRFGGRLSKDLPLSELLKSLEENGNGVKFRLEGRNLFVR